MKTREFRPMVGDAKLEDRVVMNAGWRVPAFYYFQRAWFTPVVVAPPVSQAVVTNVSTAINLNLASATNRVVANNTTFGNQFAAATTDAARLTVARNYVAAQLQVLSSNLPVGNSLAAAYLPNGSVLASNLMAPSTNPNQVTLNLLNTNLREAQTFLAGTPTNQEVVDTFGAIQNNLLTPANLQAASAYAATVVTNFVGTLNVIQPPVFWGWRRWW